jgi:hypothetical protein
MHRKQHFVLAAKARHSVSLDERSQKDQNMGPARKGQRDVWAVWMPEPPMDRWIIPASADHVRKEFLEGIGEGGLRAGWVQVRSVWLAPQKRTRTARASHKAVGGKSRREILGEEHRNALQAVPHLGTQQGESGQ